MKKLFFVVLLATLSCSLAAQPVDVSRHMSGSWYNPNQDGHGISLEIVNDTTAVFYWYIYNPDGTPTFLIAVGEIQGGVIIATAYHQTGMHWGTFNPGDVNQQVWGQLQLDFQDCNNLNLVYSSTHGSDDIPFGDGSIPMVKLASIDKTQCHETRAAGIYRGYLETGDDDIALGATFLMAGDGTFAAWVDDQLF